MRNTSKRDQLPPSLSAKFKFGAHSISLDCHQLYIAIVANASVHDRPSSAMS